MAKNIIILGAGASVPYGAPVMKNFLDQARELYASGTLSDRDTDSFGNVFSAISNLQAIHSKSEFDLINLESIFTTFELSKTIRKLPGRSHSEIEKLINDLKRLIVVTLEEKITYKQSNSGVVPLSESIFEFLKSVKEKIIESKASPFAILTFNYDVSMDLALDAASLSPDYGLPTKEINKYPLFPLLKLHGSLNWASETESKKITPWTIGSYKRQKPPQAGRKGDIQFKIGSNIHELQFHSGSDKQLDVIPFIVPPSWNKADSHNQIAEVWSRAAEELSEADSIYIIGYSLPNTDSFFRQLYALGTISETLLKRFWVYNPDPSREQIFKEMLGPGARERFKFFQIVDNNQHSMTGNTVRDPFYHIHHQVLKPKE